MRSVHRVAEMRVASGSSCHYDFYQHQDFESVGSSICVSLPSGDKYISPTETLHLLALRHVVGVVLEHGSPPLFSFSPERLRVAVKTGPWVRLPRIEFWLYHLPPV